MLISSSLALNWFAQHVCRRIGSEVPYICVCFIQHISIRDRVRCKRDPWVFYEKFSTIGSFIRVSLILLRCSLLFDSFQYLLYIDWGGMIMLLVFQFPFGIRFCSVFKAQS